MLSINITHFPSLTTPHIQLDWSVCVRVCVHVQAWNDYMYMYVGDGFSTDVLHCYQ